MSQTYVPNSVVWTPIPFLTWILPFVGHAGIVDSHGRVHDFQGPYFVNRGEDSLAFGQPAKYILIHQLVPNCSDEDVDVSISTADDVYCGRMHNLICDNCHSHVCNALNRLQYGRYRSQWNMVKLGAHLFFRGKFIGVKGFAQTWFPFSILVTLIVVLSILM